MLSSHSLSLRLFSASSITMSSALASPGPPLLAHDHAQHLVLQPLGRDHEVEQRHLDGHLGQVVRVAQLGRDVEAELLAVLDGAVAQLDARCHPA